MEHLFTFDTDDSHLHLPQVQHGFHYQSQKKRHFPATVLQQALQIHSLGLLCLHGQCPGLPETAIKVHMHIDLLFWKRKRQYGNLKWMEEIYFLRKEFTTTIRNCSASSIPLIEKQLLWLKYLYSFALIKFSFSAFQ